MVKTKEFLLNDIAKLSNGNKLDKNKMHYKNPTINFVSRTANNNGVSDCVDKMDNIEPFKAGAITLAFGGSVGSTFLQESDFYTGQNVGVVEFDNNVSKAAKLYIVACIEKVCKKRFVAFSNEINKHFKTDLSIELPVKTVVKPDFDFINNLMKENFGGGVLNMSNIDTSSWKEFKIGDLFDIDSWVYGKNRKYEESKNTNGIAVVSGITTNNGINYYTEETEDVAEIYKNCLTITTRGEYSGTVFYHDYPFVLANNILVMPMKGLSKEAMLFIGALINKLPYGGYNNYPTKDSLKEDIIKLPVTEMEEIDWGYMEEKIQELEQEKIQELEQYLNVTGLNDYELTDEDKKVLSEMLNGGESQSSTSTDCLRTWEEFRIGDLFEIKSSKKIYHAINVDIFESRVKDSHPYVVRTAKNNGIRGYIITNEETLNEKNTISFAQDTAQMFYQRDSYYTGNKVKIMKLKEHVLNEKIAQFLVASMKHGFKNFGWGQSFDTKIIENVYIYLPTKNHNPDYEYMEKYIRAIEKQTIKNVVEYKDKVIEKTKEIIEET